MIVLEVPSRYLIIDEAHYAMMASVLGQVVPVEAADWDVRKGIKKVSNDSYPKLLLLPHDLMQESDKVVLVPVPDVPVPKASDDYPF